MVVLVPYKTLPSGAKIPVIGLGAYLSDYDAVASALKIGYRHIDTAQFYKTEDDVGRAVRDSGIPREEVFVTSKLYLPQWSYSEVVDSVRASNERVGLGYIDLFLLHAPGDSATRPEAWRALEDLQMEGVVKDIGISNFSEAHYKKLLETARVKPAVNQIELHPWCSNTDVVKFFDAEGVVLQAYSPLVKAKKFSDPTLTHIAEEIKATPAQVLVAYGLAKGFVTLPKSSSSVRQEANLEAVNLKLTSEQVAKLDALDEHLVTGWDAMKQHAVYTSIYAWHNKELPCTYRCRLV